MPHRYTGYEAMNPAIKTQSVSSGAHINKIGLCDTHSPTSQSPLSAKHNLFTGRRPPRIPSSPFLNRIIQLTEKSGHPASVKRSPHARKTRKLPRKLNTLGPQLVEATPCPRRCQTWLKKAPKPPEAPHRLVWWGRLLLASACPPGSASVCLCVCVGGVL